MMRFIGINGGTFDPIHYGHLRPALEAMQLLGLHQVRFIPCFQPVHRGKPQVSAEQRCEMIELALQGQPNFVLDKTELLKGGPSYMVETLEILRKEFAEDSLVLMMGTDAFAKFDGWYQWQRILELANIVILHRPGEPVPQQGKVGEIYQQHQVDEFTAAYGQISDLAVTQLDISSTQIRDYLGQNLSVQYLLPFKVLQYIENNKLYRAQ
ncbi:nicotinate-nucleotide adenylyltransferase [Thiomicrorhabdus sediminis]|nr:nicotinate-nucleotide adenylyltransferase [Thiomicrorhabdus sediminis]